MLIWLTDEEAKLLEPLIDPLGPNLTKPERELLDKLERQLRSNGKQD